MRAAAGVPAILDALEAAGDTLGLVTGNIVAGAERKLGACELWHRFGFGAYGSDAADRNALPPIAVERGYRKTGRRFAPENTWIVGDTPQDIACALASDLRVLAVATGRFSVAELLDAGAHHAIEDLDDTDSVMALFESDAVGRARTP